MAITLCTYDVKPGGRVPSEILSVDDNEIMIFQIIPPAEYMAAISQTTSSNAFYEKKNSGFWLKFRWSLFLCPIDNKPVLVQVMACAEQATNHYLRQYWTYSLTHICGTRGRWVFHVLLNILNSLYEFTDGIIENDNSRYLVSFRALKIAKYEFCMLHVYVSINS